MQNQAVSFCKRDIISTCTSESYNEQKNCRFYSKSSYNDKCMYHVFDEYCSCVEAQRSTAEEVTVSY